MLDHEFELHPWVCFRFGPLQAWQNGATRPPSGGQRERCPVFFVDHDVLHAFFTQKHRMGWFQFLRTRLRHRVRGAEGTTASRHTVTTLDYVRDRGVRTFDLRYRATMGGTAGSLTHHHNLRARTQPHLTERSARPTPPGARGSAARFFRSHFPCYNIDTDCSSSHTVATPAHPTGVPGGHTLSHGNTKTEHQERGGSSSFGWRKSEGCRAVILEF